MKTKDEKYSIYKVFHLMFSTHFGASYAQITVELLEYISSAFQNFLLSVGITS